MNKQLMSKAQPNQVIVTPFTTLLITLFLLTPLSSEAFCLHNQTPDKLYFMVEAPNSQGQTNISYRQWVEAGKSTCCDWRNTVCNPSGAQDAQMSFYAFADEESLEGCDLFGSADAEVYLTAFTLYDRCHWK